MRELKNRGLNIIKALPVSEAADFQAAIPFSDADYLLFDAKPPLSADSRGYEPSVHNTIARGRTYTLQVTKKL